MNHWRKRLIVGDSKHGLSLFLSRRRINWPNIIFLYYTSIYISNRPLYAHIILNIRWWCSSPRVGAILLLVSITTVTTIYYVILLASVLARISPRHPPHPYLPPLLTPMLLIVSSPPFTTTDSQPPPLDVPPTSRRDPESATHQCTECLYYVSARCTPSSTPSPPLSDHLPAVGGGG